MSQFRRESLRRLATDTHKYVPREFVLHIKDLHAPVAREPILNGLALTVQTGVAQ